MTKVINHLRMRHQLPVRRGATLIELLVVIVILVILAAAAVPIMAPAIQNRQVREAARIVNGFLTGARNRAMLNGRPVGVVLDRMPGLNEACVTLSYAEVPAPYNGDSTGSTAALLTDPLYQGNPILAGYHPYEAVIVGFPSGDVGWSGNVRPGDLIKFAYNGRTYRLVSLIPQQLDANGYFYFDQSQPLAMGPSALSPWYLQNVTAPPGWPAPFPPPTNSAPYPPYTPTTPPTVQLPFQIIRSPVRIPAGAVQLPGTTVIDLDFSGFDLPDNLVLGNGSHISPWISVHSFQPIWTSDSGSAGYVGTPVNNNNQCPFNPARNDTSPIIITFSPSGAMDSVWCWPNGASATGVVPSYVSPVIAQSNPVPIPYKPVTPMHLLIGKRELLPLPTSTPTITDPTDPNFKPYCNWHDLTNFWVSINPQSGMVSTVENSAAPISPNQNVNNNNAYGAYSDLMQARLLAIESLRSGGR